MTDKATRYFRRIGNELHALGDDPHPHLHVVEQSPWNKAESYRPDPIEMLRERLNERRLEVVPRIGWVELGFMCVVAMFIGVCIAAAM